jgi:hypothetical protein
MLPHGFRTPERRPEKSRGPCAIGSVDAVGATGRNSGTGSCSGSGKLGTGSTGMMLACTKCTGAGSGLLGAVFVVAVQMGLTTGLGLTRMGAAGV